MFKKISRNIKTLVKTRSEIEYLSDRRYFVNLLWQMLIRIKKNTAK